MTKRFQNFKNTVECNHRHTADLTQTSKQKNGDIALLEAIKSEKDDIARHILLEKQFSNLELQDRRRDGKK